MSSSWYTNKIRVLSESAISKVQYPEGVQDINRMLPSQNCNSNFNVLNYVIVKCNIKNKNCFT